MTRFFLILFLSLATGCGGVTCERAKLVVWQKRGETTHPFRVTLRCFDVAGKHADHTLARSQTRIETPCKPTKSLP